MRLPLLAFLFIMLSHSIVVAQFAGGSGTVEDPYRIRTVYQLQQIYYHADRHFIQVSSIDAEATQQWNGGRGFKPIGDTLHKFTGSYRVRRNSRIINLIIDRPDQDHVGLFGLVEGEAVIENVRIQNSRIRGAKYTGGLIGYNSNGQVDNSSFSGVVQGGDYTGGLIGYNSRGRITNSIADSYVEGGEMVGGIIGYNYSGYLTNSRFSGDVTGSKFTGKIVGLNAGRIKASYAGGEGRKFHFDFQARLGVSPVLGTNVNINDDFTTRIGYGFAGRLGLDFNKNFSLIPEFIYYFPESVDFELIGRVNFTIWQLVLNGNYYLNNAPAYLIAGLSYTSAGGEGAMDGIDFFADTDEIGAVLGFGLAGRRRWIAIEVKYDTAFDQVSLAAVFYIRSTY